MTETKHYSKPVYCRKVPGRICAHWKGEGCIGFDQGPNSRCKFAIDYDPTKKFEYGTIEEADRRLKVSLDRRDLAYCPLKDGFCRIDCDCFKKPKIINQGSDEKPFYECDGGYCTAYALVGPT